VHGSASVEHASRTCACAGMMCAFTVLIPPVYTSTGTLSAEQARLDISALSQAALAQAEPSQAQQTPSLARPKAMPGNTTEPRPPRPCSRACTSLPLPDTRLPPIRTHHRLCAHNNRLCTSS
jgi:hypothetical protein